MNRRLLILASFIAGFLVLPIFLFVYLTFGKPPVAAADAPFPLESKIVKIPLEARIHREMPGAAPFSASDDALRAGAEVYQAQCAICHGAPNEPSTLATMMFPRVPQLWAKHTNGVVGVSDDPAGETYWKIENGIRLSGMPAYRSVLSDTQIWQVSLLLADAGKPLPPAAAKLLAQ